MNSTFLPYLVKANMVITLLTGCYFLFFRKNSFHLLNRVVLLSIPLLAIILPIFDITTPANLYTSGNATEWDEFFSEVPVFFSQDFDISSTKRVTFFNLKYIASLYLLVVTFLLYRFLQQIRFLCSIKRRSVPFKGYKNVFLLNDPDHKPFTFIKWVFLPAHKSPNDVDNYVIRHELAHSGQYHFLDLFLAEFLCIVFWFNPFVFLLKRSLKTVHEYLADEAAANTTGEKMIYLSLLAKHSSKDPLARARVSSNFNFLTLKKRINMITKHKTSQFKKAYYLLFLPALAILLMAFTQIGQNQTIGMNKTEKEDNVPSIMPIKLDKVKKSSGFGMRIHPIEKVEKQHNGIDLAAEKGTPVMATAAGIVVKVEYKKPGKGYGRKIVIQHNETYATLYAQLSEFKVTEGEKVSKGQVIGLVGSSGVSTGPHLHYEIRKNGEPVDPENYFK